MRDFRDLQVWHKAHNLALSVYQNTNRFPKEEIYGLTSQIRRAAVSIPSNICEGCGRDTDADFARFLQIAAGSASELEYQLQLAHELGWLETTQYQTMHNSVCEIKRMLASFLKKLRSAPKGRTPPSPPEG